MRKRTKAGLAVGAVALAALWGRLFLFPPAMGPAALVLVQDAELSCFEHGAGALLTWGGAQCVLSYQPAATDDDPSPAWRQHPSIIHTRFVGAGATVYATEAVVHAGYGLDEPVALGRLLGGGLAFRNYMRLGGKNQITKQVQLDAALITHFAETAREQIDAEATWGFDHSVAFSLTWDDGEPLTPELRELGAERSFAMASYRGPVAPSFDGEAVAVAAALRCPETHVRAAGVLVGNAECVLLTAQAGPAGPVWRVHDHLVLVQWRGLGLAAGAGGGAMSGEILTGDRPRSLHELFGSYDGGTFGVWVGAGEVSVAGAHEGDASLRMMLVDEVPGVRQTGVGVSWNTSSGVRLRDAGVPLPEELRELASAECGLLARVRDEGAGPGCEVPDPLPPRFRQRWEALSTSEIDPAEVDQLLHFSDQMGRFGSS